MEMTLQVWSAEFKKVYNERYELMRTLTVKERRTSALWQLSKIKKQVLIRIGEANGFMVAETSTLQAV